MSKVLICTHCGRKPLLVQRVEEYHECTIPFTAAEEMFRAALERRTEFIGVPKHHQLNDSFLVDDAPQRLFCAYCGIFLDAETAAGVAPENVIE